MEYGPLVESLVKQVVERPDQVVIEESTHNDTKVFQVYCAKDDVGKVVGKAGRVIHAIREVVRAVAHKHKDRISIKVDPLRS